jgi:hypothetical protein
MNGFNVSFACSKMKSGVSKNIFSLQLSTKTDKQFGCFKLTFQQSQM